MKNYIVRSKYSVKVGTCKNDIPSVKLKSFAEDLISNHLGENDIVDSIKEQEIDNGSSIFIIKTLHGFCHTVEFTENSIEKKRRDPFACVDCNCHSLQLVQFKKGWVMACAECGLSTAEYTDADETLTAWKGKLA